MLNMMGCLLVIAAVTGKCPPLLFLGIGFGGRYAHEQFLHACGNFQRMPLELGAVHRTPCQTILRAPNDHQQEEGRARISSLSD